ncbi:tetratricopeptide repeat protein [Brevundimonas sp.]|uniref:tetratricopeptide repeat protein n=1 Tax=Brevundimonas sp. TaxID=1871086 RepID=UPI002D282AA7|nr:tetratricopeptide repeat protein [Brevundimonas sp.]HYC73619.1 tetratricopeptide repeat protein [Brevundimonas sp.]
MRTILIVLFALFAASVAHAGDTIARGPAPAWVKAVPAATPAGPSAGDAFRIELFEQQFRFDEAGTHTYIRTRAAVLAPQALAGFGTVALPWNPASQDVTVHTLDIIRGGERIDALAGKEFAILRREANLEAAIVDGVLTATLQLDDLRVGDRLEFAYSVTTRIPVLGSHAEFVASGAVPTKADQFYLRGSWPTAIGLRIQASDDWAAPAVRRQGDRSEFEVLLNGLEPVLVPDTAPLRFHQVRLLEGTDYRSWADLAAVFAPLYAEASMLAADSPLRAEVERIRAANPTPADQVLAALRLVQDEVRYLALAMGEGGLVPATADDTWNRRLGDCKGKTVLLLALLRELGVAARPVLVNSFNDGLDTRLPTVASFDHVIVQAEVDGQTVWLDGTRSGDRSLVTLPALDYGWVLPVESAGAALVRMPRQPPGQPLRETSLEIDLSKGLYGKAPVTGEILLRGDSAVVLQSQFSVAQQGQRDAYMRSMWPALLDDVDIREVGSAYDVERNEFRLTMAGETTIDWASRGSRRAEIPVSRVSWDAGERRDEGPFRDVPIVTNYPLYSRFRTTIILPDGGEGFVVDAVDIDEEAAAYHHRRRVTKDGARVVMERETLTLRPEMTEAERAAAEEPLQRLSRAVAEVRAPNSYDATSSDLTALESDDPRTASEWVNRALALNSNGRSEEALTAFDRAIALDPTDANAYANRGITRFWLGDARGAAEDFDKASEINPAERIAMNGRGLIALAEQRHLDAVVEFSMSLRSYPDDPFVLGVRSQAYLDMGEWEKALADLRKVRELRPASAEIDLQEIDLQEITILTEAGRLEEAAAAAAGLVERNPTDVEVMQLQASVLQRKDDFDGAEAVLDRAVALEPDHPLLLLDRAAIRLQRGNLEGARADMAVVRPIARESAGLLNNLCWTQAVAGVDLEQALKDCDAALALRPEVAGFMDSRGLVLLHLGRPAEALEVYDRALELEPRQAASLYGRGLAKQALGRAAEAAADKAAAVRLSARIAEDFETYEARAQ